MVLYLTKAGIIIRLIYDYDVLKVNKEVDELKLEKEKLTSEQTSLKLRLNLLQDKCDADAKKHLTTIAKLQAQLKEKTTRRKVRFIQYNSGVPLILEGGGEQLWSLHDMGILEHNVTQE